MDPRAALKLLSVPAVIVSAMPRADAGITLSPTIVRELPTGQARPRCRPHLFRCSLGVKPGSTPFPGDDCGVAVLVVSHRSCRNATFARDACARRRRVTRRLQGCLAGLFGGFRRGRVELAACHFFDCRAHGVAGAPVLDRVEQRGCGAGAADQDLRIRQHDRVVPGALHDEGQIEASLAVAGGGRNQACRAFEIEVAIGVRQSRPSPAE